MEKKVYSQTHKHTHTHIITEKTKTIYPLYTSYAGGIMIGFLFGVNIIKHERQKDWKHTCM